MKKNLYALFFLILPFFFCPAYAQFVPNVKLESLPQLSMQEGQTLHILSPEPVQYVDISSERILGDLPLDNILRLKLTEDSLWTPYSNVDYGTVTLVGESFLVQYRLVSSSWKGSHTIPTLQEVQPEHMRSLEVKGIELTRPQMESIAVEILSKKVRNSVRSTGKYGTGMQLNGISTLGDYVFLDLSFSNTSNLSYSVDALRFFIEDKKILKATNVQSIELKPLWQFQPFSSFQKNHRNVFVLKKATFPGNKMLRVNLTEAQISGRTLDLRINYKDVLKADTP